METAMKENIKSIALIIMVIIAAGSLLLATKKKQPPLLTQYDIILYDSTGVLVGYKQKKEWHIINAEKLADRMLKEIYRANQINQMIAYKLDSVTKLTRAK